MKRPTALAIFLGVLLAGCGTSEEKNRASARNRPAQDAASKGQADASSVTPHGLDKANETAEPPCRERPSVPEKLTDAESGQAMLAEFNKLYETGKFQLGYCVADVQVTKEGTVEAVRVVRPRAPDRRVEAVIVRSIASQRYKPAIACGHPVAFTLSVGIGHCPTAVERNRKRPG